MLKLRNPWLLLLIPAMSGGFAVAFKVLLGGHESSNELELLALRSALFGLFPAMWLTARPTAPRPP